MRNYQVQLVGQPARPVQTIEAYSPHNAVEIAAGCHWRDVCLPIWRRGRRHDGSYQVECYMPLDNSGRQWLVFNP